MKINITSRHFKATDAINDYVKSRLEDFSKYNEKIIHADVVLAYETANEAIKSCEIKIKLNSDLLVSKEQDDEFEKAIDKAASKIEAQIYKVKDKHKTQKHDTDTEIFKTI